jgi:hypothetical protein
MQEHALNWFPAITTTTALAIAAWLARNLIVTRLKASVSFEFNEQLEKVKSDLRTSEEKLRSELAQRDGEIRFLRETASAATVGRKQEIDKRKLEAIDQIWEAVAALAPARVISKMMAPINFKEACKASPNPAIQKMISIIGSNFDPKKLGPNEANKARPFLSPWIWAIFSAYQAVVMTAIVRWQILLTGVNNPDFVKHDKVDELLKTVLPQYTALITEHSYECHDLLLEDLENLLITELQRSVDGTGMEKENVEKAAKILKLTKDAIAALDPSPVTDPMVESS